MSHQHRRGHGEGSIYQRESDGRWCASVMDIYGHVMEETQRDATDRLDALLGGWELNGKVEGKE